ncbi:hypothetical protein HCH_05947 [Hahella chejuensis KCTC 2396]|uniref:DUF2057 domain-containing protein n=1 Tax=Hahella chejuensis (strain KCTC 2396) TaxID=349521 RepID=Q2S9S6_HAHCH|nr:DUF2057 domain-containing protein [Hahella chejuensis]ABC32598.1 hypothetical protein HCH_05947 [Hahella chejuensis KCTC 2396]
MKVIWSWLRSSLVVALAIAISACGTMRAVKTYDGQTLGDGQVAKVIAPAEIELLEIDGVSQKNFLLENIDLTYDILPGQRTLVYRYTSIWAKPRENDDSDAEHVDKVVSDRFQVTVDMQPGQVYTFGFNKPDSKREAEAFIKAPKITLVDSANRTIAIGGAYQPITVAASQPSATQPSATQPSAISTTATVNPAVAAVPPAQTGQGVAVQNNAPVSPSDAGISRIEALKVLWEKASAEEKKQFLRWAFK